MQPRPLDPQRDLPAVADLLGRMRASGGQSHPGGIQWWLRELAADRDDFDVFLWGDDWLGGFVLVDGTYFVMERIEGGPTSTEQLEFLEQHMRDRGRESLSTHVADGDPPGPSFANRGYTQGGYGLELIADMDVEPPRLPLPEGFRFTSLEAVTDEAYIDGHRAAWSDNKPSPYRRELHEAVKQMPQFRPDLVAIALDATGMVASYCIGWMDEQSQTLEIEPLGTHRDFRRMGLASAIVREVQHRAWANGAKRVLVWNDPSTNPAAYDLYTGAGMVPGRHLTEMTKTL